MRRTPRNTNSDNNNNDDVSVDSKVLVNGSYILVDSNPSRSKNTKDVSVVVEEAPFDEGGDMFFPARTPDAFSDGQTRIDSLEIINGLAPGEPIPIEMMDDYASQKADDLRSAVHSLHSLNGSNDGSGTAKIKVSVGPATTRDDDESTVMIDFSTDDYRDMTYGRRIALWMMKKYQWYNPQLTEGGSKRFTDEVIDEGKFRSQDGYPIVHSKEERPSLEKAWAYFDHVALPRFIYEPKQNKQKKGLVTRIIRKFSKANKQLNRAEPGEAEIETRLYSPIWTPHGQLGDWGLGIGLYFSTLRSLTLLSLVAGLIHIPNFIYFAGPEYSDGQEDVPPLTRGSAICTNYAWVACPSCRDGDFRNGDALRMDPDTNATFARKNFCEGATIETGLVNYIALIFVVVAAYALNRYLHVMEVQYDEDEQTAQDYSIVIDNPPSDATDPEEWREYFMHAFGAHVTGCTVAVDNDDLVHALVERREKMRMLELLVEPGTKLDIVTLAGIAAAKERERSGLQKIIAMVAGGIPEIFSRMAVLTAKIQGLAQQDYPVTNVFITFETERDQRRVLRKLSVGQRAVDNNRKSILGETKYLFRGFRVLAIREPEEPDAIRWDDLNVALLDRLKQQFFTGLATIAALVVVAIVVNIVNDTSPFFTAYTIAIANAIFPLFAKFLTYNEAHPSHGSLQTSLYFKIAIFRWVTTAIIITIVTPFESTLWMTEANGSAGLIDQIEAQFWAEITTTSAIQLADPVGHLQRHFLAPRATTQDGMNLLMQGTVFELAERYTAAAKLLFLTFWYCSIYPGAFFWCAASLQVIYYLDKFSLTRTWKRVPRLGNRISQFNRRYFLPFSILAMAVFSSYYWSGFPFDNLCMNVNETVPELYVGNISTILKAESKKVPPAWLENITIPIDVDTINITIAASDNTYRFCSQNLLLPIRFPFIPYWQPVGDEWMEEEQELVTTIYGWTGAAFVGLFLLMLVLRIIQYFGKYFNGGGYDPTGEDQGQNFSDLDAMNIYIPQVESAVFSYPLLAASVDNIDEDLLDWTDPEHPHAFYDLTKDANALVRGINNSDKVVFSQVAHWPPPKN